MDTFITTYRKDYRWPVVPAIPRIISELPVCPPVTVTKTEPIHLGAAPESNVPRSNQPDAFLNQLYDSHPYPYGVNKITQPEDLKMKVFSHRYISTYQQDYGKLGSSQEDCFKRESQGIYEGEKCPDNGSLGRVNRDCSKMAKTRSYGKCGKGNETGITQAHKPWVTEYMDNISKMGGVILKQKLLSKQQNKRN